MTTVRGSATVGFAGAAVPGRGRIRPPGLGARPPCPDARVVRARLPSFLVEPVGVVDLRFGEGPRAGDRGGCLAVTNEREPTAVEEEVREVHDGEHHEERAEGRPASEQTGSLCQLL